jgi:glycosyltransferase involved in cell wall biosynthesis
MRKSVNGAEGKSNNRNIHKRNKNHTNLHLKRYMNIAHFHQPTVSQSTKNDLIDLGFKDVRIITEGISIKPLTDVPEKEKEPTLIFVGRMGRAKLPDHLMEAFTYIKKNIPDAKLWMVGDGTMRKKSEENKPDDVTFFGYVEGNKKHELMSRAHAVLVPGGREGWGLVVTEANALGTPAVGYNVHGLREKHSHNALAWAGEFLNAKIWLGDQG